MKPKKFKKVGVCNDWASETFYIGPIVTSSAGTHSFQNQDQSRRIKDGDLLEVEWPTGEVEDAVAIVTQHQANYGDWGHIYNTTTERLHFRLHDKKRGALSLPLDVLNLKVRRK